MDRENCPRALDAVVELDLDSVLKSDELAEFCWLSLLVLGSRWASLDLQPCCFSSFVAVLEMIFVFRWVFVGSSSKQFAVVALVKSCTMAVDNLSEPLMIIMSSANLKLDKFASWPC